MKGLKFRYTISEALLVAVIMTIVSVFGYNTLAENFKVKNYRLSAVDGEQYTILDKSTTTRYYKDERIYLVLENKDGQRSRIFQSYDFLGDSYENYEIAIVGDMVIYNSDDNSIDFVVEEDGIIKNINNK